jgi:hypothetical protein
MKMLSVLSCAALVFVSILFSGCAGSNTSSAGSSTGGTEAGAGTSDTAQAPGGPGHGPEGAMNGAGSP